MKKQDLIKDAVGTRWVDLLVDVGGIPHDVLDGKHHPCPKCGGEDRFRLLDAATGAVLCNQCFREKNGDGIAAIGWMRGWGFRETVNSLVTHLGLEERARVAAKKAGPELQLKTWEPSVAALWCLKKRGVTVEALEANGASLALRHGRDTVVALAVRAPDGDDVGRVYWNATGRNLARQDGTSAKVLLTRGCGRGWIGTWALDHLSGAEVAWKVEGPTDMLALWSAIPEPQRASHVVLTNPFGSTEKPTTEVLEPLRGKRVYVCHDPDDPGRRGAARWAEAIATVAAEVRVVNLPTEGQDLRDWLSAGGTYEQLLALAASPTSTTPTAAAPLDEPDESENDPSRLAKEFLRARCGNVATQHDQIYYWRSGAWRAVESAEFRGDLRQWLREEFARVQQDAAELHRGEDDPPPKAHKITCTVVADTEGCVKAYSAVAGDVPWGSELEETPALAKVVAGTGRQWISVENGILDLAALIEQPERALRPHTNRWWSPNCLPFPFDPTAGPEARPRWEAFLQRNLEGDTARIDLLQEWAGYLLHQDTSHQKFLLLEGEGANGKSVYCAVLMALLGKENVSHVPLELFGQRFQLTATLGKLANIVTEIGELDRAAEGLLKSFVAGEPLMLDRKGKEPICAAPTARLVLATNNRPRFADRSQGLWRRLTLVPFRVQIPEGSRVRGMDKPDWWVRSGEMPAILNWALEGLSRLLYQGHFTASAVVQEALDDYRAEANPAREFLLDRYVESPGRSVEVDGVYKMYSKWCEEANYRPLGKSMFGREVGRVFPAVTTSRSRQFGHGGDRVRLYNGLVEGDGNPVEVDLDALDY